MSNIEYTRNQEAAEGIIERAGQVFPYRHTGHGRLPYLCKKACCIGKERFDKTSLLPCECHSLITLCTCKLRDKHCQRCRKTWITGDRPQVDKYVQWYEIDEPHAARKDA